MIDISKIVVAIDDGHGENTPGKRSPDGYKENWFNRAVKKELCKLLDARGIKWIDIAEGDLDMPLMERVRLANSMKATIFISIHFNTMGDTWREGEGGIETYYYKTGHELAKILHKALMKGTRLKDRGVKFGDFAVLRETSMPAALVELGFMDVKKEEALMKSPTYIKECADELYKGICDYFAISYQPVNPEEKWVKLIKIISNYSEKWIPLFQEIESRGYPIGELFIIAYNTGKQERDG